VEVVVYSQDDDLATVQVLEDPKESTRKLMTVDGCTIGWSWGYRDHRLYQKQVLLAHLPLALDTRIRDTLNIGLGSSATLYTLAAYPQVQTLDCVEISRAVVRAAELFPESTVLDDPRVNLVVDDAVHFLLRAPRTYDLIISDGKEDPFYSGNATLLCEEFYKYALGCLNEQGLFIQWLPLNTLRSDFQINLRTLCSVFPHVEVFCVPPNSVFVMGARQPFFARPGLPWEDYDELPISSDLAPYEIDNLSALLACWCAGKPQLQGVLGEGPVSTWDQLLLDFSAFKAAPDQWARATMDNLGLLVAAGQIPRPTNEAFVLHDPAYRQSAALVRQALAESAAGRASQAHSLAEQAVRINPADRVAQRVRSRLETTKTRTAGSEP
jgi:spermidine synthase